MNVVVKPYLFLRQMLNFKENVVELKAGATVYDLLEIMRSQKGLTDQIITAYGKLPLFENGQPIGMTILVDGRNIKQSQGTATILKEGAVISLFPPAAGG